MVDIITILLFGLLFVVSLLSMGYIGLTAPIAFPYIVTKLKKGALLILKTHTGNYRLVTVDESYSSKKYGNFIPNQDAIMRVAGVNIALGSTKMAIIPSHEACAAAEKLEKAQFPAYQNICDTADKAAEYGILKKVDVDALYRYSNNISPNFVTERIAIRVHEILSMKKGEDLMKYVMMFIMIVMVSMIAIYMIKSGAGGSVVSAASSVANTSVNI